MADRITNGARLSAQSWKALREHRRLLVFPLVSGLVLIRRSGGEMSAHRR